MIIVTGRKLEILPSEKQIGVVGDHNAESRTFLITDIALFDLNFKLDVINSNREKGIIEPTKVIDGDSLYLTWYIKESEIGVSGTLEIQIRAFDDDGSLKWHSYTGEFEISNAIKATDAYPDPLPSEFEEMELRVTTAKNTAVQAAETAADNATAIIQQSETERVLAEEERVENEANRATAEGLRSTAEEERDEAETARQNYITSFQALENLKTDIKGTTQTVIFNTDETVQKIQHKDSENVLIREDVFTYGTNLITEVRTIQATGATLTYVYHTDTLVTEVI